MEIELKYRIPTAAIADEIWDNVEFKHLEEDESREEVCFKAEYFDTSDHDLAKNGMVYRIRKEGCRWVATLKWKGHTEGALHIREELNVPVDDNEPDLTVFRESKIGNEIIEMVGDVKLTKLMETAFKRKRLRLDTGSGIYELSIDRGVIITPCGEDVICELELELFSGETEELEELGKTICETYGLERESRSKYSRGLDIIKKA